MGAPEDELELCRQKLLAFFLAQRCRDGADELASETLARVLERIRAGEAIGNLGAYCLGVARNVWRESRRTPRTEAIDNAMVLVQPPADPDADVIAACLERCVSELTSGERSLLRALLGESNQRGNRLRFGCHPKRRAHPHLQNPAPFEEAHGAVHEPGTPPRNSMTLLKPGADHWNNIAVSCMLSATGALFRQHT